MQKRQLRFEVGNLSDYTTDKIDGKKIIAHNLDTTFAVVKRKAEKKIQACTGFEPYDLCDTGAAL